MQTKYPANPIGSHEVKIKSRPGQEGQLETKDTTTENDDTLRDSKQPDHKKDLTTDPDEDPTAPMD